MPNYVPAATSGFEDGSIGSWVAFGPTLTNSVAFARTGTHSMRASSPDDDVFDEILTSTGGPGLFTVPSATTVTFGFWYHIPSGPTLGHITLYAYFFDVGLALLPDFGQVDADEVAVGGWTEVNGSFVTPPTAAFAALVVTTQISASIPFPGGFRYYDDFFLSSEDPPVNPIRRPKPSLSGRLGCGVNSAFITSKGGSPRKGTITNAGSITYDRRLDDISLAEVVANIGGNDEENCCELLADIEPWCDELHIERNGVEVWVGPVTEVIYDFKKVTVRARDVLFWLQVRILQSTIDTTAAGTGNEDITTTALRIINDAFAGNDPPNILPYVHATPTGTISARLYTAFGDTDLNYFTSLATTGMNFTAIGRTIIIGGRQLPLNSIATLTDLMILSDISVNKTGLLQGNRIYEHFTGDAGAPAVSEVPFQCYGRIEQVRTDDLPDLMSAQQTADAYAAAVGTAPRILEVTSGGDAALSPETPWSFEDMIPGVQVTIFLERLCIPIEDRYQLTYVQVQQSGDHLTETVSIRLGTVNPITGKL